MSNQSGDPAAKRGENQPPPALFIGLGSIGAKIVSHLQEMLFSHGDDWTKEWFYYVAITSEEGRPPGLSNRVQHIPMSQGNMETVNVVDNLVKSGSRDVADEVGKWWYFDDKGKPWYPPFQSFEEGCGAQRPCGRMLAMAANLKPFLLDLRGKIDNKRDDLANRHDPRASEVAPRKIDCYVFGLLAGGTCAGMISDFAFLLKDTFREPRIDGTLLLGDICYEGALSSERNFAQQHGQQWNTTYALAELYVLQSSRGREIAFPQWARNLSSGSDPVQEDIFKVKAAPYSSLALVGARRDSGLLLPNFDAYAQFVAEYYGWLFVTKANVLKVGRDVDERAHEATVYDAEFPDRPNNICRIGLLNLQFPDDAALALCEAKLAAEIAAQHLASADAERCVSAITTFGNAVNWNNLTGRFEATADTFIPDTGDDPVPGSVDEFRKSWLGRKSGLDGYYGDWRGFRTSSAVLDSWVAEAIKALGDARMEFLGGGRPAASVSARSSLCSKRCWTKSLT